MKTTLEQKIESLLAVPEVRKAAANWATDELLAVRNAIGEPNARALKIEELLREALLRYGSPRSPKRKASEWAAEVFSILNQPLP